MKEHPIPFSQEMVRAILDERKTQTRRVIKPQPLWVGEPSVPFKTKDCNPNGIINCPYGKKGDWLWVRETWYYEEHMHDLTAGEPDLPNGRYKQRCVYRASSPDYPVNVGVGKQGWTPSIHMPRWASRITLEIDEVRVERLQNITKEDAMDEGVIPLMCPGDYREAFKNLWDVIYSKRGYGWEVNPLVWVIEFHIKCVLLPKQNHVE